MEKTNMTNGKDRKACNDVATETPKPKRPKLNVNVGRKSEVKATHYLVLTKSELENLLATGDTAFVLRGIVRNEKEQTKKKFVVTNWGVQE